MTSGENPLCCTSFSLASRYWQLYSEQEKPGLYFVQDGKLADFQIQVCLILKFGL